jgi:hypothetical protein
MYYGAIAFQDFGTILGSDRNYLAMDSVKAVCLATSTMMSSFAITRVKVVIEGIPKYNNENKNAGGSKQSSAAAS